MATEIKIPIDITVTGDDKVQKVLSATQLLVKEQKELKSQLLETKDAAEQLKLAEKIGEIRDKLKDANEQIKVFATGSKFEQISNSFSSLKGDLVSLDFEGAAEKAKVFSSTLKSIKPDEIKKGFANLGAALGDIKGGIGSLIKNLPSLGGAFKALGTIIKANPIIFIASIIIGVGVALYELRDKIGFVKVALEVFSNAVGQVVQTLKNMSDAIGLTEFAAEEAADGLAKSAEKTYNILKKKGDDAVKLAAAQGKDTKEIEKKNAQDQIKFIQDNIALAKKFGNDQRAETKVLIEKGLEEVTNLKQQSTILDAQIQKEANDKALQAQERQNSKSKAARDRADALEEQAKQKHAADLKNIQETYFTSEREKLVNSFDKNLALLNQNNEKEYKTYQDLLKLKEKALQDYDKKVYFAKVQASVEAVKDAQDEKQRQLDRVNAAFEAVKAAQAKLKAFEDSESIAKATRKATTYKGKIALEDERFRQELEKLKGQQEAIALAEQVHSDNIKAIKKQEQAEIFQAIDSGFNAAITALNDISALQQQNADNDLRASQTATEKKLQGVKKGSAEEKAIRKQAAIDEDRIRKAAFEQNKKMQIASAILNGIKGVVAVIAGMIEVNPGPAGIVAGAIAAASLAASTAISVAKMKATKYESTGTADSSPSVPDTTVPATPQVNLFGNNNNSNNLPAGGGGPIVIPNQTITVNAIVSETEITATQEGIKRIENASKL